MRRRPSLLERLAEQWGKAAISRIISRGSLARKRKLFPNEEAVQRRAADEVQLLFGEDLRQMADIQVAVLALRSSQGRIRSHECGIRPIGRHLATVAVNHCCHAFVSKTGPPPRRLHYSQHLGRRLDIQCGFQAGQNLYLGRCLRFKVIVLVLQYVDIFPERLILQRRLS